MTTLDDLRNGFTNPPRSYGLLPLWDLNNDLLPDDIHWGLEEQAKQGVAGVFLHPRSGMEVEYLSEDYWRAIKTSLAECKSLGLETWLYDEYNWPSGVAGGQLLREHPEYRQVFLDYRTAQCADGDPSTGSGCELSVPPTAKILSARAWRVGSDEVRDVMSAVHDNVLRWAAPHAPLPAGEGATGVRGEVWQVAILFTDLYPGRLWATGGAPWTRSEAGALDYLNPDAVREFIRLTHEEYRKRFGDEFGKQIPGIFTDEPATFYGWQWTPRFLEIFRERMGYDLTPHLHELVFPVGNYVKTRCDYHQVALDLYANSFFKQIGEWCEQNHLIFTGHLLYEDKLDFLPAGQGGFFATLRHMRMPGVDYLGDRTGYEPSDIFVAPNVGPKALSSLAHATGKTRSLVELYGGNGWATTLARYKNVLNWIAACGVNCIDPHAAYLSLKGHRKRDFPASHFVQNPWWRYYHHFARYVARLSYLNAQGQHVADIALLYPQSTFWSEHVIWAKSDTWNEVVTGFTDISTALLRLQRDYDYLFEETLLDGTAQVTADGLRVGAETFSIVVLPPLTTIPLPAMNILREFVLTGGTLIALGRLPTHSTEQRDDPRLKQLMDELFRHERAVFVSTADVSLLAQHLDAARPADVTITSRFAREFIYQHRQMDDAHCYLIANLSEQAGDATISLRATGVVEAWDVDSGAMSSVSAIQSVDGRTQVTHHFLPYEMTCLVLNPISTHTTVIASPSTSLRINSAKQSPHRAQEIASAQSARLAMTIASDWPAKVPALLRAGIELTDWQLKPESPNCLLLEPWQVRYGNETRELLTSRYDSLEALSRASKQQAAAQGLDPSEWTFFMRVARDPDMQAQSSLWPPEGAEYERTATVRVDFVPDDVTLVYEDLGDPVSITINGRPFTGGVEPCFVWDRANRQIALQGWLQHGENTIALRTRMPSYRSLPPGAHGMEPVILRGSFGVRDGGLQDLRGFENLAEPALSLSKGLPLRSWTELGWPNYSGAMTYSTSKSRYAAAS